MSDAARIVDLHRTLMQTLSAITQHAEDLCTERCPYRAADDRCTFAHGCRNQDRSRAVPHCTGAQLNHDFA